eukprot:COSAG02_NODE_1230_length_13767_cov_16.238294_14_plen_550_part_00
MFSKSVLNERLLDDDSAAMEQRRGGGAGLREGDGGIQKKKWSSAKKLGCAVITAVVTTLTGLIITSLYNAQAPCPAFDAATLPKHTSHDCSDTEVLSNFECAVTCGVGYRAGPTLVRTPMVCKDGDWVGSPPICTPERCIRGLTLAHSHTQCTGYTVGEVCDYMCTDGFVASGIHTCGLPIGDMPPALSGGSCVCLARHYLFEFDGFGADGVTHSSPQCVDSSIEPSFNPGLSGKFEIVFKEESGRYGTLIIHDTQVVAVRGRQPSGEAVAFHGGFYVAGIASSLTVDRLLFANVQDKGNILDTMDASSDDHPHLYAGAVITSAGYPHITLDSKGKYPKANIDQSTQGGSVHVIGCIFDGCSASNARFHLNSGNGVITFAACDYNELTITNSTFRDNTGVQTSAVLLARLDASGNSPYWGMYDMFASDYDSSNYRHDGFCLTMFANNTFVNNMNTWSGNPPGELLDTWTSRTPDSWVHGGHPWASGIIQPDVAIATSGWHLSVIEDYKNCDQYIGNHSDIPVNCSIGYLKARAYGFFLTNEEATAWRYE